MSRLVQSTLGNLCILVTDGTHDSPPLQSSGVPFIKAKHISNSFVDFDTCDFITYEDHLKVIARSKPEKGDILFTHIGASLGITAYINTVVEFSIKNIALFKPNPAKIDSRYLYYIVISSQFQNGILNKRTGSAQPFVSLDTLRSHEVNYHPALEIQRKITAILSAYDRLIENNTRRIKILEEMARSLYDKWFVKFRFPDYEQTKMVDSELGLISEGWEVKTLGNVCNIVMGQSPKSEFYNEIGEGLPFHQGVTNFGDRFPIDKTYCSVLNRIAEAGDILFSVRAPVGRINIATKKIIIGRGLCAIRSKLGNQAFLFQQLKEKFQEEDSIGGGTIFKSVTKEDMHGIKIIVPPSLLIYKFEEIIQPVFRSIEVLTTKNTNLRQTRDVLLPKLISGEIDVENLDIETGIMNESEEVSSSSQEAIAG